jgi:crotonobetainyl-CoA:carnitine CoA-transferase CaiB-like acyl-CoA transferase
VAGRPELARDARYAKNADRVRHRSELVPLLESLVRARPMAFWAERLEAAGVPCGPINSIAQALADPQIQARGLQVEYPHPLAGRVPLVACPIVMDGARAAAASPPPTLGADTRTVLGERLGLDAAALDALAAQRVI